LPIRNTWKLLNNTGAQTLPGRLESDSLGSGARASACFLFFLSSFFKLPAVRVEKYWATRSLRNLPIKKKKKEKETFRP